MSKLSGKALADRARELNIPGRSKMSADELRDAILAADHANVPTHEPVPTEAVKPEPTFIVPNRAESRKRRRNIGRRRNDGTPIGGHTPTFNRADRTEASVRAGQQGKHYGNRNPDARRVFDAPREVPVNVIHEGH